MSWKSGKRRHALGRVVANGQSESIIKGLVIACEESNVALSSFKKWLAILNATDAGLHMTERDQANEFPQYRGIRRVRLFHDQLRRDNILPHAKDPVTIAATPILSVRDGKSGEPRHANTRLYLALPSTDVLVQEAMVISERSRLLTEYDREQITRQPHKIEIAHAHHPIGQEDLAAIASRLVLPDSVTLEPISVYDSGIIYRT
jgi:hypothetical protein